MTTNVLCDIQAGCKEAHIETGRDFMVLRANDEVEFSTRKVGSARCVLTENPVPLVNSDEGVEKVVRDFGTCERMNTLDARGKAISGDVAMMKSCSTTNAVFFAWRI